MQAVILTAGKSTRTYPLTFTRPKALLKILNKPILEHSLDQLKGLVDEVILVVGYKADMIKEYFGSEFSGMKITYVEQGKQLGTGHAVMQIKDHIKDHFLVLMGDDIYMREAIVNCLGHDCAVHAEPVKDPSRFGVFIVKDGFVDGFVEKPKDFVSNLANTAMYHLDKRIFDELASIKKTDRGEYELTDAVLQFSKKNKIRCVETKNLWISVGDLKAVLEANSILLEKSNKENDLRSSVENSKIFGSSIGENCEIKDSVIKGSIIMDGTKIEKSVICNSIIGYNVKIKSGTKILENNIGAIIGDNCELGSKTIIHPGIKIWPGNKTDDEAVLTEDLKAS